ncbi:hypothetical protein WR25_03533 [Diploscapter pachys]|uniref:WH2 domain-containing protein n=1 Tax=Diploscapter pachys TaxID=2018661 RepID=A0A2A2JD20_9BILA|nr:hypothetical protein WR25_03533 [Diploscapter pachys]
MTTTPFCEPCRLEYEACLSTDYRGYGGILTDPRSGDPITQYNLALAWNSPNLTPKSDNVIRPLIDVRDRKGTLSRPPGHLRFDQDPETMRHRNLLAARKMENRIVRLWTVSERSERKQLETFQVEMKPNSNKLVCSQAPEKIIDLDEPANELRIAGIGSGQNAEQLWIRSRKKLDLLYRENNQDKMCTIFGNSVSSFEESSLMNGEVAICDVTGKIWSGKIDEQHLFENRTNLARTKNHVGDDVKLITYSDHPRVLYAAADFHIRTLDLREDTEKSSTILFGIKDFHSFFSSDVPGRFKKVERAERPPIRHVKAMPADRNCCLVMTGYAIYLLDERWPNMPLLTLRHQIPYAAEFCYVPQPNYNSKEFRNEEDSIQSVYLLSHYMTGLHSVHLYRHNFESGGSAWSEMGPISHCGDPSDFWNLVRSQPQGCNEYARRQMNEPTRSVALIQEFGVDGTNSYDSQFVDTLFRTLDDGSVWYQTLRLNDENAEDEKERAKGIVEEIEKWSAEREDEKPEKTAYLRGIPKVVEQGPKSTSTLVSLQRNVPNLPEFNWNPRQKMRRELVETPEPEKVPNAKLAGVVEEIWNKTAVRAMAQRRRVENVRVNVQESPDDEQDADQTGQEIKKALSTKGEAVDDLNDLEEDDIGSLAYAGLPDDCANLAQTYSALATLAILGDDFSRVDRDGILKTIRKSQKEDGCFWGQGLDSESDMRFVYCAAAICHILADDSAIVWQRLGEFIKSSRNYDGGIGQGPGDESHGGSSYCAIASLALSNRLWNGEILTRADLDKYVKWALWKQNVGLHGRAHKPDDSCYSFWIGATLETLNAHSFLGIPQLRTFLMSVQHPFMGGFCKLNEPGAFPDMLHAYFSIAALSLMKEPGFAPMNAQLNVTRRVYERIRRVPLVGGDLDHEETLFRLLESLRTFSQKSQEIIGKVEARTNSLNDQCDGLQKRAEAISKKLTSLKTINTAIVLEAPALFPDEDYTPFRSFYSGSSGIELENNEPDKPFIPSEKEWKPIDVKRELESRKHMYVASQALGRKKEKEKKRNIPKGPLTLADLFVAGTSRAAYPKVGGAFEKKKSRTKMSATSSRPEQTSDEYPLGETAIVTGKGSGTFGQSDPLAYRPQVTISGAEELQLPDTLPHLPGIASDVTFNDIVISPSMLPDIDVDDDVTPTQTTSIPAPPTQEPPKLVQPPKQPPIQPKEEPKIVPEPQKKEEPKTSIPPAPPIPSSALAQAPPPAPPSVPPPAPPPPPPVALISPTHSAPGGADSSNRSDLMAAIRAAGGTGKAQLKSVKTLPNKKTDSSLDESSALPSKSSGEEGKSNNPGSSKSAPNSGGDLMSSLAKALEARRKAIAGKGGESSAQKFKSKSKPSKISGPMSKISDLIPPPPQEDEATEDTDPEWD